MTKEIFVFGSNREGRHGKGAALTARLQHGAIYGQARGLQGNSFGIVTKELRKGIPPVSLQEIKEQVQIFLKFAELNPDLQFNITKIGCGLAGFNWETQIKPLFNNMPNNCKFI